MSVRFAWIAGLARAVLLCLPLFTWPARPAHAQLSNVLRLEGSTPAFVEMNDGELRAALDRAVRGAQRRLAREECVRLLTDFNESPGRPLIHVLSSLGLSPVAALSRILFRDGRDSFTCRSAPTAAFTGAASRVVFICGNRFTRIDRSQAELIVIHELLHTLGLGEQPPTSGEIDRVVARRCGG